MRIKFVAPPPAPAKQLTASFQLFKTILFLCLFPISVQGQVTWCSAFLRGKIINIGAPNTSTDASSLSDTHFTNGTKIFIQGDLKIDVSTSFDGCLVQMGTDASLTVSAPLDINNSIFFSCQNMWAGITVVSSTLVDVTYSHFEDALVCFNVSSLGTYRFTGNTFNRNYVGIRSNVPFAPTPFDGNTFSCTSTLKAPKANMFSKSGMEVNSTAILGVPNQTPNTFAGLQCGLFAQNSAVTLYRANFSNMFSAAETFGGQPGGSGVIALNCNLRVNEFMFPYNQNTACQFINNQRAGIMTRSCTQTIRNSLFRGNWFGIDSRTNTQGQGFLVEHSEFLNLGLPFNSQAFGIFHERSNASGAQTPGEIRNNRFVTSANASSIMTYGIRLEGTAATGNYFNITHNYFENFSPRNLRCISVVPNQADNFNISNNEMLFHQTVATPDRHGIELLSGSGFGHEARTNVVVGDQGVVDGTTFTCGFHVVQSPNFIICQDSTDWGWRGYHFPGNSNRIEFRENIAGRHRYGLHLGVTGQIGVQVRTLNRWSTDPGAYGEWAALNDSPSWSQSRFITHSADAEFMPTLLNPSDWFTLINGDHLTCAETFSGVELDSFDRMVAAGNQEASSAAEAWDSERRVYLKLQRFPDLAQEPEMNDFFGQIDSTSSGQFARVDFALWQVLLTPGSEQDDLDELRQQIDFRTDSIAVLDSLLGISFDSTLFASKSLLAIEIDSLLDEETLIAEQVSDERLLTLDTIALMVDNLPETEDYEQARSDYLKLLIQKWRGIDFDASDVALIHALVLSPDSLAGVTALDSRILLSPEDSLGAELIDPSCSAGGEERQMDARKFKKENSVLISLQPNPANEYVILQFAKPVTGQARLFDLHGKAKLENRFEQGTIMVLETAGLSAGIYICLIQLEEGDIYLYKLAISR